jgi:hypothetical protein
MPILGHQRALRDPAPLADPTIATPDSRDVLDALTEIHVVDVAASIVASLAKRQPGTVDLEHRLVLVELDRLDLAQVKVEGP